MKCRPSGSTMCQCSHIEVPSQRRDKALRQLKMIIGFRQIYFLVKPLNHHQPIKSEQIPDTMFDRQCPSFCRPKSAFKPVPLTLSPPVMTVVVCSYHLLMFLGSLYGKQYGSRSDCSLGSSLICVHMVCF